MVSRQQRRAAARKEVKANGKLSIQQTEELRQILQPLMAQYRMSLAELRAYFLGAGISMSRLDVDMSTGTVTVVQDKDADASNGGPQVP